MKHKWEWTCPRRAVCKKCGAKLEKIYRDGKVAPFEILYNNQGLRPKQPMPKCTGEK